MNKLWFIPSAITRKLFISLHV